MTYPIVFIMTFLSHTPWYIEHGVEAFQLQENTEANSTGETAAVLGDVGEEESLGAGQTRESRATVVLQTNSFLQLSFQNDNIGREDYSRGCHAG